MEKTKSFKISKRQVWEAYKKVKANKGSAGVDGINIKEFDKELEDNLYKIWNRLSSGSYMPPAVLEVEIPKEDGGSRRLGIPTVSDRIAQTVVRDYLEPKLERYFYQDSYGYRPNKSAHQALKVTQERCYKIPYVVDLDIKGFFDNINHEMMIKALEVHTQEKWILLYIKRWLKAPIQQSSKLTKREKGTPQGGVISPLLANLFLHYAFDRWISKKYPTVPFERYADDIVCHCRTLQESEELKEAIQKRLEECKLELHPKKTKIVYCKDVVRKGNYENTSFDFLGYTFRPRVLRSRKGNLFVRFHPAMSRNSAKKIRRTIRSWKIQLKTYTSLESLSKMYSAILRGWINYYTLFEKYTMKNLLERYFDVRIIKWDLIVNMGA
jgi:group II intron reverse transcriptase/maturase